MKHIWVNHYGTDALIEATSSLSFERVGTKTSTLAAMLEAVRRRGADPTEARLAAEIFGHLLAGNGINELDPGSGLSIDSNDGEVFAIFIFAGTPTKRE